ncbi:MAG: Crp/Fnr family transcriptional regulator [Gammaproteobacteria bacterium]|nr:MAG: Crp/Fnr family transcriptional regulator [Gammaproteobacteria bacterium]
MKLNDSPLLSHEDIARISAITSSMYKKGAFVFQAGTPGKNIYLLNKGRIKLYRLSPTGKEITQWFCFPGEVFGLAELPSNKQRSIYAQCCENCEVTTIPLNQFKNLLATSPEIAIQVIEQLSLRLKIVGNTLLNVTADDSRSRIIKLLIRLSKRFGVECNNGILIDVVLTHKELADMVGTCRQTVTTMIGDLKRDGYIEYVNHLIVIHSMSAFEALTIPGQTNAPIVNKGPVQYTNPGSDRGLNI